MSNETKREVFEKALGAWDDLVHDQELQGEESHGACEFDQILDKYRRDYATALPDDLPVIPKAVSEWIKECKHNNTTLANALCMEMRPEAVRWWMEFKDGGIGGRFDYAGYPRKQEIMAKAWLLGVWRVEETGEVVKVEAPDETKS